MKNFLIVLLLCLPLRGLAATYYVSTTGSDAADGSEATPWRTIDYGQAQLAAGDTLIIKAGTYYEGEIKIDNNGTSGNEITIRGELDVHGNHLTILNSATVDTIGQWVHDPTLDHPTDPTVRVYKNITLGYKPEAMLIGGKSVLDVGDSWMPSTTITCAPVYSNYTGLGLIAAPYAAEVNVSEGTSGTSALMKYWELYYGLYGWDSATSTVYLRVRDGTDPNTLDVRVTESGDDYCLDLRWREYVIIKDLSIKGCDGGIDLGNSGTDLTVDNCKIAYSTSVGVYIAHDAANMIVKDSEIFIDLYGRDDPGGPWNYAGTASYGYDLDYSIWAYNYGYYRMMKCVVENASTGTDHINIFKADAATVQDNLLRNGRVGVNMEDSDGCTVKDNTIKNNSSTGIFLGKSGHDNIVEGNLLANNNLSFRVHDMNQTDQDREYYVLCNRAWNAHGVGEHIYVHWGYETGPLETPGIVVFSHNQFHGARMGIGISSYAITQGGMPRFALRHNLFASQQWSYVEAGFYTTAGMMQESECNAIYHNWHTSAPADPEADIPWWGSSNAPVDASKKFAPNTGSTEYPWNITDEPDWDVVSGSFLKRCTCPTCYEQE